MDEMEALRQATRRLKRLDDEMIDARTATFDAVIAALRAGNTPTEVTEASPYSAAYIRRIARENGIEPARPGPKKAAAAMDQVAAGAKRAADSVESLADRIPQED